MSRKKRQECFLHYPEHHLTPEDFLHFVELDEFADDWKQLGFDVEQDLWALQIVIMSDPEGPPVISGTGGLRKLRFGKRSEETGKRGGVRVCYVYFPAHWTVLLVMAYGKDEKDALTDSEKKGVKKYIAQAKKSLAKHNY